MEALLDWYRSVRRPLPWRRDADPYRVLVSEAMLQQTRVETVLGHYDRWLARFPDVKTLADATSEEVMAQWSGLGYYRRARNLHAAAKRIVADGWPLQLTDLPGIGPYAAAAVGSIAFGKHLAAVDGNVTRVVTRFMDLDVDPKTAAGRRAIQAAADDLLAAPPGDWNQAMMELGATVCTPRPRCDVCPVATACRARARGTVGSRPRAAARPAPVQEVVHFAYLERDGRVLLVERPPGLLAGTWCLPGGASLDEAARQVEAGLTVASTHGPVVHRFTHRTWTMHVHRATAQVEPKGRWVPLDALGAVGLSTAARRAIAAVTEGTTRR